MRSPFFKFLKHDDGASMAEYGILAVFIAAVSIAIVTAIGAVTQSYISLSTQF